MTENLYIFDNGIRKQLDLNSPSGITLSFKSVLFGDLSSIAPSSSYTFELPLTTRNKEVLGLVDDIRETKSNFGKKFECLFLVDGFDLCRNAYLYVDSVKDGVCSAVMTFNVIDGLKKIKENDVSINELTSNDIPDNPNALIKDGAINMDNIVYLEDGKAQPFVNTNVASRLKFNCGIIDERTDYTYSNGQGTVEKTVGNGYGVVAIEEFDEEARRIENQIKQSIIDNETGTATIDWGGLDTDGNQPQVIRVKSDSHRYIVPAYQILRRIEELYGLSFDFLEEKNDLNDPSIDDYIDPENENETYTSPFIKSLLERAYNDLFNFGVVPIVTTKKSKDLEDATAGTIQIKAGGVKSITETIKINRTTDKERTTSNDNVLYGTYERGLPFIIDGLYYFCEPNFSTDSNPIFDSSDNYDVVEMILPHGSDITIKGRLYNIFGERISDKTLHLYSEDDEMYVRETEGDIDTYRLSKSSTIDWDNIGIALLAMPHDPVSYFIGNVFGWWDKDTSAYLAVQTFELDDDVLGSPWEIKDINPYRYQNTSPAKKFTGGDRYEYEQARNGTYFLTLGNSAQAQIISGELRVSVNWSEGKIKHWVDIYSCLPDISCLEFIKSLFVMSGAVPVVNNDGTIGRLYYSDLYDNVSKAVDWSDKFVKADNISYRDDMAQHNYILMQQEDMKSRNKVDDGDDVFEGDLWNVMIADKYLDNDKELYKLPYYGRWLKRGNMPNVDTGGGACVYQLTKNDLKDFDYNPIMLPHYFWEIENVEHKYRYTLEANEMKPIFGVPTPYNTMQIWNVNHPNDKHLNAFRKLYGQNSFTNVKMLLTIEDLCNLDYSIPVYISQFNSYFAIVKIDWHSESGVSDVQLCKIEL